jgi:hypothetical protein
VDETATNDRSTVCGLTDRAMDALIDVERALGAVDGNPLSPLEFRTLLWAKCSLATLYGIRADETMAGTSRLVEVLDGDWMASLLAE